MNISSSTLDDKATTAYTSLPIFEAAHILIQDLSHWFLFYVLLLPFEMVFAPETTFSSLGSEIYVCRSPSNLGQPMAASSAGRASIPPAGLGHQNRIVSLPCTLTEAVHVAHMWTASDSLFRNGRFPTYFFHNSLSLAGAQRHHDSLNTNGG